VNPLGLALGHKGTERILGGQVLSRLGVHELFLFLLWIDRKTASVTLVTLL
jgi:hypothetical protein